MDIIQDIARHGGLAATHELHTAGWTKRQLASAVAAGIIVRVRQGWYASPTTLEARTRAVRVGGRLTCASAVHDLGLWELAPSRIHVSVERSASRLRHSLDRTKRRSVHPDAAVVVHWRERRRPSDRFVTSIHQILMDMVWCYTPEIVVATVDSALHAGWLQASEWLAEIARLPARLRRLLALVDGESESFLESIMRFRLRMLGIRTRLQVRIPSVGRVDLVIGTRLVIELDGWRYHRDRDSFEEDRRRDARLAVLGYRVLRFTYRQLMRKWQVVRTTIAACIAQGHAA